MYALIRKVLTTQSTLWINKDNLSYFYVTKLTIILIYCYYQCLFVNKKSQHKMHQEIITKKQKHFEQLKNIYPI